MTRILTMILSAGLILFTTQTASARDNGGFGSTSMDSGSYAAFEDPAATDPSAIEPAAGEEDQGQDQNAAEAQNEDEQSTEDPQQ